MVERSAISSGSKMLLAGVLASGILVFAEVNQSTPASGNSPAATAAPYGHRPAKFPLRATAYFGLVWGVDSLRVKYVESGEIIKFTYRVLDPDKAKALNDKKAEPALYDAAAGVSLVVPSLEKVGQLRQSSTPIEGRAYWMAFSNRGRRVKPGDRVSVVIGQFRADGLVVE